MTIDRADELVLLDEAYYGDHGYPFHAWDKLRREDPIHYVKREGKDSYWAVTRYQDIVDIQGQPEIFRSGPRSSFSNAAEGRIRTLISMDPPDHRIYRDLVSKRFTPKGIQWVRTYVDEIIDKALDRAMARNGEVVDLMEAVVGPLPTSVISRYLGVPEALWPKIIEWTDRIIGAFDVGSAGGQDPMALAMQSMTEMNTVYAELFKDRARNPKDDLLTDLIQARVNGAPIPDLELFSFCLIFSIAGHETTKSTGCAGMHALATHPEQMEKLRQKPELVRSAIEEILRYVSPAIHFCRTPNRDVEVGGKSIKQGDTMVMFYPSANRDAEIFQDPYRFDIERTPNRHLAFGTGPHQCLGMNLARLELRALFEHLMRRLENIEIVGPLEMVRTCLVGSVKRLPVRMTIRPRDTSAPPSPRSPA